MKKFIILFALLGIGSAHARETIFLHPIPESSGVYQTHYNYKGTGLNYPRYWQEKGIDLYETSTQDPNFFKKGTRVDVFISPKYELSMKIQDSLGNTFTVKGQDARRLVNPVSIFDLSGNLVGSGTVRFDPKSKSDSQRIGFSFGMVPPNKMDGFSSPSGDFYAVNPKNKGHCVFDNGYPTHCFPTGAKTWIISSGGFESD